MSFLGKIRSHINFKISLLALFTIIFLTITLLQADNAASQTEDRMPGTIRLGIRNSADLLGRVEMGVGGGKEFSGFCNFFGKELEDSFKNRKVEVKVENVDIVNEYLGANAPRYQGLRDNLIDIECGPNSLPLDRQKYPKIKFSVPFYETGTKILLRQKLLDDLLELPLEERIAELKTIRIGAIEDTTTIDNFKYLSRKTFEEYNYKTFYTRRELLDALERNEIDAYASDSPILETLWKKKYIDKNYALLPRGDEYLPGFDIEKYAMALLKYSPFVHDLEEEINSVLQKPIVKKYLDDVKEQESILGKYQELYKKHQELIKEYKDISDELTRTNIELETTKNKSKNAPWYTKISILAVLTWIFMLLILIFIVLVLFSTTAREKLLNELPNLLIDLSRKIIEYILKLK